MEEDKKPISYNPLNGYRPLKDYGFSQDELKKFEENFNLIELIKKHLRPYLKFIIENKCLLYACIIASIILILLIAYKSF